jgi:hypothetical protein
MLVREMARSIAFLPRSMRLAISTSPSRVRRGTVPISRRYMRTGSFVLSSAPGVRSSRQQDGQRNRFGRDRRQQEEDRKDRERGPIGHSDKTSCVEGWVVQDSNAWTGPIKKLRGGVP